MVGRLISFWEVTLQGRTVKLQGGKHQRDVVMSQATRMLISPPTLQPQADEYFQYLDISKRRNCFSEKLEL